MGAEDGVLFDRLIARRTVRTRMIAENLTGDISGLLGVIAADPSGHEEGVDEAEDGRNPGPGEKQIGKAETVAADVKVVNAKAAQKDGEKDADGLVVARVLVFGVEPAALMVAHVRGVDGIGGVHVVCSRLTAGG